MATEVVNDNDSGGGGSEHGLTATVYTVRIEKEYRTESREKEEKRRTTHYTEAHTTVSATGLMCMHEKDIIGNYFASCTWPV